MKTKNVVWGPRFGIIIIIQHNLQFDTLQRNGMNKRIAQIHLCIF